MKSEAEGSCEMRLDERWVFVDERWVLLEDWVQSLRQTTDTAANAAAVQYSV